MSLLELDSIVRDYRGAVVTRALRGISFRIDAGEFVAIVGPSGSGKSTLLNVLGLLDRHDSGRFTLKGADVAELSEKDVDSLRAAEFGFVFQDAHGLDSRTVAKNVELPLLNLGLDAKERLERVSVALGMVGLLRRANHVVGNLSGGEKQRMAIARGLVHRPDILLLDEPTGNLDSANANAIFELLAEVNSRGTTVILITHDDALARRCRRVIRMRDGRVDTDETRTAPQVSGSGFDGSGAVPKQPRESASAPPRARFGGLVSALSEGAWALTERPWRTLLNLSVIALGAAGLVGALGISQSASAQVSHIFDSAALDEVRITGKAGVLGPESIEPVEELLGVRAAGLQRSLNSGSVHVGRLPHDVYGSGGAQPPVLSASGGMWEVLGVTGVAQEQFLVLDDPVVGSALVFVGAEIADELGVPGNGVGVQLWIQDRVYNVAGLIGGDEKHPLVERAVIVSELAASELFPADSDPTLILRTEPGFPPAVAAAVPLALDPGQPGAYTVQSTADLAELRRSVDEGLAQLFAATGAILLLVAVLSTSSSLSAAVLSRRREIGLRRGIGQSSGQVSAALMAEGGALGLLGGIAGAAIGMYLMIGFALAQGWTPTYSPSIPLIGGLAGLTVGVIAAIVPAARAARISPALALRE